MTRHPVDILSLASGLIVVALGLLLLTGSIGDVPLEWVGPAVAIGLGVLILFAALPRREPSEGAPEEDD
jgi:hypothetical protein